ncbi:stage II sporulation protein M [Rhodovulum sp. DZ06]|uniref:stage II sporulation protein M n=1 Tax=Rhodovulum sp. DZ06 TaxID=3425126 RepID=UPI003D3493C6
MTLESPNPQRIDAPAMRSARFRAEREAGWSRLEALVAQVEKRGVASLAYAEAQELTGLYRQAVNALSVARAISLDAALLEYLEALCARAYMAIYAPQEGLGGAIRRMLGRDIPRAMRANPIPLAIGFGGMLLGALLGYALTMADPSWFDSFVPGGLAQGRGPEASEEALRATLFDEKAGEGDPLAVFATYLFSHNTQVSILVFALGIFAMLPTLFLSVYNGGVLGAFVAVFVSKGLGVEVAGWLSIHGVTEISALCITTAAGARLGLAALLPGDRTRGEALREAGSDAVLLFGAAVLMLVAAALVEGFLRQMVQDTGARLAIGWGLGALWAAWFWFGGRGEDDAPAPGGPEDGR